MEPHMEAHKRRDDPTVKGSLFVTDRTAAELSFVV